MTLAIAEKIDEIGRTFDEFKIENGKRLDQIEKNGHAQSDLEQKVHKINTDISSLTADKDRLDKIEAAFNRGEFAGGGGGETALDKAQAEHSAGFDGFFRTGNENGLRDLEMKAELSGGSDPDGGFTVPVEVDTEIDKVLGVISSMRGIARLRPVGSATYKKLINVKGTSSGWVGETEARGETNTPQLKELEFPVMEIYAEPHATQALLDDSSFSIESWLADEVSEQFAEQEGSAFINGDGVKKPRGILGYTTVANSSYSFGNVGYVVSGAAGAFKSAKPWESIIDLMHSLKSGYRNNARFLMNDLTVAEIRKFSDTTELPLWQPGLIPGAPDTLFGRPVVIDDNMPNIGANSHSIAFSDFQRSYVITDRMGTRVLRDPYTRKPYIKFYTTKRVGGGIQNFEAIKLMQFSV